MEQVENKKGLKFLIADDQVRQRDVLVRILRTMGHKVIASVDDGLDAISKMKELSDENALPDVCLLDISMRELNGNVAAEELQKDYPGVQIILVSSMGQAAVGGNLIEEGFGFISKPYTMGQFSNRLNELLNQGA